MDAGEGVREDQGSSSQRKRGTGVKPHAHGPYGSPCLLPAGGTAPKPSLPWAFPRERRIPTPACIPVVKAALTLDV